MIASIKSEFRKMFSIRSTYVILALALILIGPVFGFWGSGLDAGESVNNPLETTSLALNSVAFISIFTAIIALLSVTHEYRHNTIMYTLTSSNSRTKTLIAKMLVILVMSLVVTAVGVVVCPLMARLGMNVKGLELVPQTIDYMDIAWRTLYFGAANGLFAAILAVLIRNQVGTIMTYFIVINTIEELIGGFILKQNAKWLPFTSLQHVINMTDPQAAQEMAAQQGYWSPGQAALLFTAYLVIGGIVAWLLFLRRDAN
jgi:ABC-2 type transport system permease protein